MKTFFIKIFCLLAFILCFAAHVFADELNITSVIYDNSAATLVVNSMDNDVFSLPSKPKIYVLQDENKAYFDINSAILRSPLQNLVVNSPAIKEITVSQFSTNPNIVRVVLSYNQGYNPYNIQLKKLNNTFFVNFRNPVLSNYYFQPVYSESGVGELYESTVIQSPVLAMNNNILNQINSAFNIGGATDDKNYILSKKDLLLSTKFYIDNVVPKNSDVSITGIGSITLSKPIYLSNPNRVAYDVQNAVVNPSIRNKEITFNQSDTIKIGQFNKNTARIVITCSSPERYIPVIFGDTQRLVFIDRNTSTQAPSAIKSALTSAYDEITDIKSHSMKLVFSKPIVYGIDRSNTSMDLLFYNVDKFQDVNLKSAFIFDGIKMTALRGGGAKLSIPTGTEDIFDIHVGSDAKTLRIKIKNSNLQLPEKPAEVIMPQPVVKTRNDGKKYIIIDPGHGGSDCGATRNGIYEKNITLDISKRVASLLKNKGYVVKMTRSSDETVLLQERVDISEEFSPDIFVSIHVNSSNSESPQGLETHYYKDNSLKLAKTVHASLLNHINANNRGLFRSKFYVINHTTAPAILVEIGFISNPSERAQLVSESRKQATAKAIAEGIYDYFK